MLAFAEPPPFQVRPDRLRGDKQHSLHFVGGNIAARETNGEEQ
jgi:hypothetical protein